MQSKSEQNQRPFPGLFFNSQLRRVGSVQGFRRNGQPLLLSFPRRGGDLHLIMARDLANPRLAGEAG